MSMLDALKKIAHPLPDCVVFSPMPASRLFVSAGNGELAEWLRLTGTVSVPIDASVAPDRFAINDAKWTTNIELAKKIGATKLAIQWKPWHRFVAPAAAKTVLPWQTRCEPTAVVEHDFAVREMGFWADRFSALRAAWGSRDNVVGQADTEVWKIVNEEDAAAATALFRGDELLWQAHWNSPNYRYDLGGVRRMREDRTKWEPSLWYPRDYTPQAFGRAAPSIYHLGEAAEFMARLNAAFERRAAMFLSASSPPPKYGIYLTFGQSTDADGAKRSTWPRRSTAAIGCLLREAVEGHAAWLDRIIVWMTQADYASEEVARQIEAFNAGWRLFDSVMDGTSETGIE